MSMTRRSGRTDSPLVSPLAIGAGLVVLAAIGAGWGWHRHTVYMDTQALTITGPPCPTITRQAYMSSDISASHVFLYDDVRFARADGMVSCDEIADHGGYGFGRLPVCQFNSPTVLEIITPRGEFFYATRARPATVTVDQGTPSCVMNARLG
jgi:hypothetical protein